jgi:hypothetical protein
MSFDPTRPKLLISNDAEFLYCIKIHPSHVATFVSEQRRGEDKKHRGGVVTRAPPPEPCRKGLVTPTKAK